MDHPRQLAAIYKEFKEAVMDGNYDLAERIIKANPDLDLYIPRWMRQEQP